MFTPFIVAGRTTQEIAIENIDRLALAATEAPTDAERARYNGMHTEAETAFIRRYGMTPYEYRARRANR